MFVFVSPHSIFFLVRSRIRSCEKYKDENVQPVQTQHLSAVGRGSQLVVLMR